MQYYYRKARAKGKRHWKRIQKESAAAAEKSEVTEPRQPRKRRTQGEMREVYKQIAQETASQRLSRRSTASSST